MIGSKPTQKLIGERYTISAPNKQNTVTNHRGRKISKRFAFLDGGQNSSKICLR